MRKKLATLVICLVVLLGFKPLTQEVEAQDTIIYYSCREASGASGGWICIAQDRQNADHLIGQASGATPEEARTNLAPAVNNYIRSRSGTPQEEPSDPTGNEPTTQPDRQPFDDGTGTGTRAGTDCTPAGSRSDLSGNPCCPGSYISTDGITCVADPGRSGPGQPGTTTGGGSFGSGLTDPALGGLFAADSAAGQQSLTNLESFISRIIGFLTVIASVAFVVYFLLGAVSWITAGGDASKIQKARDKIVQSVIGLIVLAGSFVIIEFISTSFFQASLGFDILNFSF